MIRALLASIVRSVVGATAFERIANGGFASGASWTISNAAWSIGGGVLTSAGSGDGVAQSFETIQAGTTISYSFTVTSTTAPVAGFRFRLTQGGVVTDAILAPITIAGTYSGSSVTTAAANGVRFDAPNAITLVLDNVSLIA